MANVAPLAGATLLLPGPGGGTTLAVPVLPALQVLVLAVALALALVAAARFGGLGNPSDRSARVRRRVAIGVFLAYAATVLGLLWRASPLQG